MIWRALAVVDALALIYAATHLPWLPLEPPRVGETPAGWLIQGAVFAVIVALDAVAAAFVAVIGYSIYREIRGEGVPSRLGAAFASLLLLAALFGAAFIAYGTAREFLLPPNDAFVDRFILFDRFARATPPGESTGALVAALVLTAFLAEKYLVRWWNAHWPISIVALGMLAWPAYVVFAGEEQQREWHARQEWRVLNAQLGWLDALAACRALGPEWRLPNKSELAFGAAYATAPLAGEAWTDTVAESGRSAVIVSLAAKRSGFWRSNQMPWRDISVCESDANANPAARPRDWFGALKEPLCSSSADSPALHPSGLKLLAQLHGTIVGGPKPQLIANPAQAAVVCLKPGGAPAPPMRGRAYPQERQFTDPAQFLAAMEEWCPPRGTVGDAVSCAAFLPPETGATQPAAR